MASPAHPQTETHLETHPGTHPRAPAPSNSAGEQRARFHFNCTHAYHFNNSADPTSASTYYMHTICTYIYKANRRGSSLALERSAKAKKEKMLPGYFCHPIHLCHRSLLARWLPRNLQAATTPRTRADNNCWIYIYSQKSKGLLAIRTEGRILLWRYFYI